MNFKMVSQAIVPVFSNWDLTTRRSDSSFCEAGVGSPLPSDLEGGSWGIDVDDGVEVLGSG